MARDKPQRPRVSHLVSRLGLRAAYTKKKDDWKTSPLVQMMYEKDLGDLVKTYFVTAMDQIPTCPRIRSAAMELSDKYGNAIWPENEPRPWLFRPGEGFQSAPYEKDLFYSNPADRQFIQETIHELVVEKVLRWRKDHIQTTPNNRAASTPSDASWSSGPSLIKYHPPARRTLSSPLQQCWASEPSVFRRNEDSHMDATSLKDAGVWLGNYDEEQESVNGLSWDDVTRNVFINTLGGTQRTNAEPHSFDELPQSEYLEVDCAACQSDVRGLGRRLQIQCITLDWDEKDTDTLMEKSIWIFPCRLNGKDVFAILREEATVESNNAQCLFSFWRVNGGYTRSLALVTRPASEQPAPVHEGRPKRKRDEPSLPGLFAEPTSASTTATEASRASGDGPSTRCTRRRFEGTNDGGRPFGEATLPFQDIPYRVPSEAEQTVRREMSTVPSSMSEFDSLYDTTPRPPGGRVVICSSLRARDHPGSATPLPGLANHSGDVSGTNDMPVQSALIRSPRASGALQQTSAPVSVPGNMPAPAFGLRFRVMLTTSWTDVRKLVFLTDAMDVADVFSSIDAKVGKELDGRAAARLRFSWGEKNDEGGNTHIDVDPGDDSEWEFVVEHAKSPPGGASISCMVMDRA